MTNRVTYLDHHATTPVDPRVVHAMSPFWSERFENPSSRSHAGGREAADVVARSMASVRQLVGASDAWDVVFTSGATESDNLAVRGTWIAAGEPSSSCIVTQRTEHPAILESCALLETRGARVVYLDVDREGRVDPDAVERALGPETLVVSIMLANNEVGTIQPIEEIARRARATSDALVHCDAAQGLGWIPFDADGWGLDLVTVSAHKMYGPKGIGALVVGPRARARGIAPLLVGGAQQAGARAGTLPVPLIVGLASAAEILRAEGRDEAARVELLRDRLWAELERRAGAIVHGVSPRVGAPRLPGNLSVAIPEIDVEALLALVPEIAASYGSACAADSFAPSHVLVAMGVSPALARSTLRLGLGRSTTLEDVELAADRIAATADELRSLLA